MIWPVDDPGPDAPPPVGRSNIATIAGRDPRPEYPIPVQGDPIWVAIGPHRRRTGSILYLVGDKDDSARVRLDEVHGRFGETTETIPRAALFVGALPGAVSVVIEDRKVA